MITHQIYLTQLPLKVKVAQSCPTLCDPMDCLWNSPGQTNGAGSLSLLQSIFPIQGSNTGLLHCRWILNQLSHKGNPRILKWVACPLSRGTSYLRNQTRVSCFAANSLPTQLSGKQQPPLNVANTDISLQSGKNCLTQSISY